MNNDVKNELIMSTASKVHEDWCIQELNGYYERAKNSNAESFKETLETACYKGSQKRNEVEIDIGFMIGHETIAEGALNSFDNFMRLINYGTINIKRFAQRELTEEEKINAGTNYREGEENILRPFNELSSESQKENLEAAIGAANVYIELSQAGVTIDEMEKDPKMKDLIGMAIHVDWLKRNQNHPNQDLKVPYKNLDEWTQQQDLTVYGALLRTIKQNPEKYHVPIIEGVEIPDYDIEEKEILGLGNVK